MKRNIKPEDIKVILATDCGSTTTKAILIEKIGDEYRQTYRGEAPTTVEAPFDDVTVGVVNAITEVSELSGRKMLDENELIIRPAKGDVGVDVYISTSSAGGGLQMMVTGAVKAMTGESAQRAALGAGAIVMDILAANDTRKPHEQIERIRNLRPDMILLSGGTDGGTVKHVVELAQIIGAADPKPRLGDSYDLPIIYAGNIKARDNVSGILDKKSDLRMVDNIRPTLEEENLQPSRDMIHDLFMEHVMQQAPGYSKLMDWTDTDIMPTPGAVGEIIQRVSTVNDMEVVGVDIGGATTDIFSVFTENKIFNRTVSANLGMSYSISNVLAEAGIENVMRWVPFNMDHLDIRNRIKNKMIRPTTIPQSLEELILEQAFAKEALRLAFVQHKMMAVELKGVQQQRNIDAALSQTESGATLVNMMSLNLLVGSGGVLSHAPRRNQSAMMLVDAFLPEGITNLAVDSIFMMPHLGVLSTIHKIAATEVFEKDCIIYLGTCIAPVGEIKKDKVIMNVEIDMPDGKKEVFEMRTNQIKLIPLGFDEKTGLPLEVNATIKPARGYDLGNGPGTVITDKLKGGVVGLIFDTRGRPFVLPTDENERVAKLKEWMLELGAYPEAAFK